jgi:hypothetical protein
MGHRQFGCWPAYRSRDGLNLNQYPVVPISVPNGLYDPIMLDTAGEMLVDGRNRLKACRRACRKVFPRPICNGIALC